MNCGLACKKILRSACFMIISFYSQLKSDWSIRNAGSTGILRFKEALTMYRRHNSRRKSLSETNASSMTFTLIQHGFFLAFSTVENKKNCLVHVYDVILVLKLANELGFAPFFQYYTLFHVSWTIFNRLTTFISLVYDQVLCNCLRAHLSDYVVQTFTAISLFL